MNAVVEFTSIQDLTWFRSRLHRATVIAEENGFWDKAKTHDTIRERAFVAESDGTWMVTLTPDECLTISGTLAAGVSESRDEYTAERRRVILGTVLSVGRTLEV